MKPPFIRTCIPSIGVSPGNMGALIKRTEHLTIDQAKEEPVPEGYTVQSIVDFEGNAVNPESSKLTHFKDVILSAEERSVQERWRGESEGPEPPRQDKDRGVI